MRRVALVGAGNIARVHLEALRTLPGMRVAAVIDPNLEAARRLAATVPEAECFESVESALAAGVVDAAHVLVPPPLHAEIARRLVAARKPVLVEKPLATTSADCAAIAAEAETAGVPVGVNQNYVHHPAFVKLRRLVEAGRIGRPNHVSCVYNAPLAQLAARQFAHWMFDEPRNILLEQAVHPLSQIVALAGDIEEVQALAEPPIALAPGLPFQRSLTALLACRRMPASLRFAVGQSFPFWLVSVIGDDGVAVADIFGNRTWRHARTRYIEALDGLLASAATGGAIATAGAVNLLAYALAQLRLRGRSDPFFLSMRESIAAFHDALDRGQRPFCDAAFGRRLVSVCERIADRAGVGERGAPRRPPRPPAPERWDVAVLGGTGFIGTATVRALLDAGFAVSVLARSPRNLPDVFDRPEVALFRGDIRDREAVARAIGGASVVVNLAHGGGGDSYEAVRAAMVGGAEVVARQCLASGVRRLVHVGSIASLYLGPDAGVVTGATPSDPRAAERADYSRAKAEAERLLHELAAREGLRVVILRPGLVVGAGTPPFHAGLGFSYNDQHVIGWNRGDNPLPFVLVRDVAAAIVAATRAEGIDGRTYNLVGDVRLTARAFVAELARATGRPLRFHPQWPSLLWAAEVANWAIKRAGGRRSPLPSRREILSRGLSATFDCTDAKRDLGWQPEGDRSAFIREAIEVHAA